MKRVNNADINFVINPSYVNLANFTIKFYTTNEKDFYIEKNQDDVTTRERQTGVGGVDYIVKLDWSDLITLGEGVLNYRITNNYEDDDRADGEYNTSIERTSNYYIDSNVTVSEEEAESYAQVVAELGDKIDAEIVRSESADTEQSLALNTEIETRQNQVDIILNLIQDISGNTDLTNYYTKSETSGKTEIANALNDKADKSNTYTKSQVDTAIANVDVSDQLQNYLLISAYTEDSETIAAALNDLNDRKLDTTAYTPTDLTNYYTKTETSGATEISGALSDKLDVTAYTPTDLSDYYTKSETSGATEISTALGNKVDTSALVTAVTSASTDSQIPTAKAVYDATQSGGATYSAGTNIDITNDTISCTLPIEESDGGIILRNSGNSNAGANLNTRNTIIGYECKTLKSNSTFQTLFGTKLQTYNSSEFACGHCNVSNSGSTLFSVGNGNNEYVRHNAFEIRENGDIYITSGGTDIKLQDNLGTDLSNYYTKSETSGATEISTALGNKVDTSALVTAVTSASTDSQIPTAKAVFDAIPTGGTGGGKAVSGGTNISITTGETADTINCTLPISSITDTNIQVGGNNNTITNGSSPNINYNQINGTGNAIDFSNKSHANGNCNLIVGGNNIIKNYSYTRPTCNYNFIGGVNNTITGASYSFIHGYNCLSNASNTFIVGLSNIVNNDSEAAHGRYNVSNKANTTWGDSGNTLFSVGNGTADNARHNAFEIRQNGDIYITSGSTDIKLQDHLVSGGGSSTPIVILTQSEYDDLATKDDNTVYIIK